MEITRTNFNEALPDIKDAINNATFIAIDTELTGLYTVADLNAFDTPDVYYGKLRKNSNEFLVIQYGLSAFRYDAEGDVFKQKSYNFYIFRKPIKYLPEQHFLCQSSSIDFLISQGFDFNMLFKNGVSYLNKTEEKQYRENLEEKQKLRASIKDNQNKNDNNKIIIPPDDEPFISKTLESINDFLNSETETELILPKCNAFLRRLIYQEAESQFRGQVHLETRQLENGDRILIASRYKTEEEYKQEEEKRIEDELAELEDSIGFTKVLRMLSESNKLVIGHNMCLDLLHTIDKFLTPLPDNYEDFKDCAHALFPNVLDTKYMCSCETFRSLVPSSVLGHILEKIGTEPFEIPKIDVEENGKGYTLTEEKEHEAGYDAFLTGVCFLAMWKYLGKEANLSSLDTFIDLDLVKPYINKLHLMKIQDAPYINLGGEDLEPSREHVFYLTFPKEWKTSDIMELFSPFGNVQVAWINSTSAYVGLQKKNMAAVALSTLSQSDTYSIMTYSRRRMLLDGLNNLTNSSPYVKRKRSFDGLQSSSKKKKSSSLGESSRSSFSKRSIDTIQESFEEEVPNKEEEENRPQSIIGAKKKLVQTFSESDSWD